MEKKIFEQLKKCRTRLPDFDIGSTHLIIPIQGTQVVEKQSELKEGHDYAIIIENYVLNEPPNFTLSANWNKGTKPPEAQMLIRVNKIMGKMINVAGVGKTTNVAWGGWLPEKSIKIV